MKSTIISVFFLSFSIIISNVYANGLSTFVDGTCTSASELPTSFAEAEGAHDEDYEPGNVIDSNLDPESRWSAEGASRSIIIDLDVQKPITDVDIAWYKGNERVSYFDIDTSIDKNNWVSVLKDHSSTGSTLNMERYSVTPTIGRYIRITGHGNSEPNNDWNSIVEVDAFGADCSDLDPNVAPGGNFELLDWDINTPAQGKYDASKGCYKALRVSSNGLVGELGYESEFFFTAADGGMVFKATVDGFKTSCDSPPKGVKYVRTELREMLSLGANNQTKDLNNNWLFSTAPEDAKALAGGIDGKLTATLAINKVTDTGNTGRVGRVIIGQIHARDDEPARIYYRKFPHHSTGSIYFAHERSCTEEQKNDPDFECEIWVDLIGEKSSQDEPEDGVSLNEPFSYEILSVGNTLRVAIKRVGKADVISDPVDMSESGYHNSVDEEGTYDEYMYFKAGAYNQNCFDDPDYTFSHTCSADADDFAQVTFYDLDNTHDLDESETNPEITYPVSGSELASTQQIVSWHPHGASIVEWWLYAGSYPGGTDYAVVGGDGSATSAQLENLPSDGSAIHVTLWYGLSDGTWDQTSVTYVATEPNLPALSYPLSGTTLSAADQIFSWNPNGASISQWWFYAGSTLGGYDYALVNGNGNTTSINVDNLPIDGSTVYVTIWFELANGTWVSTQASYEAANINPPTISYPLSGATLSGVDQTFSWNPNGASITQWYLYAGSASGGYDYGLVTGNGESTSATLTNLPVDGSAIYVTAWFQLGDGTWVSTEASYTAFTRLIPAIISPAVGTTFTGIDQTISWNSNGASINQWALLAGSSPGAYNYGFVSGNSSITFAQLSNLPTDGSTVYVLIWFQLSDGEWVSVEAAYQAMTANQTGYTYYVATTGSNANNGSILAPWRNIQFGINQLEAGDTLVVNPGSYNETVLFSGSADSGTSDLPIIVRGLEGAIIDGAGLTPYGRQGLVTIKDASFITVENFEIANFKTEGGFQIDDTPVGILIEGSSQHLKVNNNVIHNIENRSTCTHKNPGCYPGANGIGVYGDTTTPITDLVFSGNEVYDNVLGSSEAFTLNGNIDGFKLTNNHVHDNNNIGIDFIGYESDTCPDCGELNRARNGIVKGNWAINNTTTVNSWYDDSSDGSAGGFYVDGGRNIIFDGNYSSLNDLGFEFASEHPNKFSEDVLMVNNYIYHNRELGLTIGGYSDDPDDSGGGSSKNIYVYNNSFYKNRGSQNDGWGTEIYFQFRIINAYLVNNIIYGAGIGGNDDSGVSDNFYAESNGQGQNINWGLNIWWAPDVSETYNIQGQYILQNPLYTSPSSGNLNLLTGSPAIDQGIEQGGVWFWNDSFWSNEFASGVIPPHGNEDINGENRFVNSLDIGADEYGTN